MWESRVCCCLIKSVNGGWERRGRRSERGASPSGVEGDGREEGIAEGEGEGEDDAESEAGVSGGEGDGLEGDVREGGMGGIE